MKYGCGELDLVRSLLSCSGFCIGKGPVFESDGKEMSGVSGCCSY